MDYKQTLNLPSTAFPMKAELAKREPQFLQRWEEGQLYQRIQSETADGEPYRFIDGPPYANGDIHIGHAVNKVLKDIIVKSRRLDGRHAPFTPGWDCHGLPIELQVEKKFGKVGQKLDAAEFRAKCREYAHQQVDRQRADFKRLGVLADWENPYLTLDPKFEAEQLRCLATIVERGHVVRGFKPVHWCLDCASSLAEAEVEYENKQSHQIDVKFVAEDQAALAKAFGLEQVNDAGLVIWTTTPWTLPANQAVAVNAKLSYALVDCEKAGMLVLAEDLVSSVMARWEDSGKVLATVDGAALEGLKAKHPFAERSVPVICGDHVTLEAGTGLVHTAPAHGVDDYVVGSRYGLPVDNPVQSNGVYAEGTPVVAGTHVRKADDLVLTELETVGCLVRHASMTHSFPHCWRHKSPLIFRATPQWFVSMEAADLRPKTLKAIAETKWIPGWGEARIREMVAGRPDWCISRQRTWGVPVAVFVHRQKQELHPDTASLLRKVADQVEENGLEAWFGSRPGDWGVDADDYEMCRDTLDVWFDSGVVHQCAFKALEPEAIVDGKAPMGDLYLEGSDQHRGWFQSSLLTSTAMFGHAPYRAVLTHGFTVDEKGRKMSKSMGNVVVPQKVLQTLGADVLRLWVSASDYSGEIAISDNLLKRTADAYRRIRNTARFLLGNLHGFDPEQHAIDAKNLVAIDAYAVAQAAQIQQELRKAYEDCAFHVVYQKLHNYCVVDLGGGYLDILKDRLYTTGENSHPRRSAQTAMWHLLEGLVRWIAPVLSFTADEIWQEMPGDRSSSTIFSKQWHAFPQTGLEQQAEVNWQSLLDVREAVRKCLENLRADGKIGSGLNAVLDLYVPKELLSELNQFGEELRFWFLTSEAYVREIADMPDGLVPVKLESGLEIGVAASASDNAKCVRCWHQRADIATHKDHPELCARCADNVSGSGETRRYF